MKILPALGLIALALLPAAAAPSGDQILRQMSGTLAASPIFRFTATRDIDGTLLGLANGRRFRARVDVLVERPDKFSATTVGRGGERRFIADGRTLTLFEAGPNVYATVPMPATLELLIARLDKNFGFTPPLAEFALRDPYRELRKDADTVTYLGRAMIGTGFLGMGGILCEHLALAGPEADAELWIGVKDHLPRRLVATFKNDAGHPQLRIAFHHWDLAAKAVPADFAFTPPKGATRIEMWTVDKMQAAALR